MTHKISANWETLFSQAKDSGDSYFRAAVKTLEESDRSYTTADAIALAAVMASEFRTASIGVAAQEVAEAFDGVAEAMRDVASALRED